MSNDLTNDVLGWFEGPGTNGAQHVIRFDRAVLVEFITFQLKNREVLSIDGIRLNEKPPTGMFLIHFFYKKVPQSFLKKDPFEVSKLKSRVS